MWLCGSAIDHYSASRLQAVAIRAAGCPGGGGGQLSSKRKLKNAPSAATRKRPMQSVFHAGQNRPPAK